MVTVEADVDQVERRLAAGGLSCPACSGVLAGWGWARPRQLRGPDGPVWLCPRRSRCTGCGVTHVLLPVAALLRRADVAVVIVAGLAARAVRRVGFRRIAAELALGPHLHLVISNHRLPPLLVFRTHDSAQVYGVIGPGGRVDSCCTTGPGQPGANNRPPDTATAVSASDTVDSTNRRLMATASAAIAIIASANPLPAASGITGSASTARSHTVNTEPTAWARSPKRRSQPRTVSAGRGPGRSGFSGTS